MNQIELLAPAGDESACAPRWTTAATLCTLPVKASECAPVQKL